MKVYLTIDVHGWDSSADLDACLQFLSDLNIPATFFIHSNALAFDLNIRLINPQIHEIASHAHMHSIEEIKVLKSGRDFGFLATSKNVLEDFYQVAQLSFRSPCWARPSKAAFEYLYHIGYRVDSSATPQRLGVFSRHPFENPWLFSKRRPHFLPSGIFEIPTTTFMFPLGSPSFLTIGKNLSMAFLKLMAREADLRGMPLTIQAHASDFTNNLFSHEEGLRGFFRRRNCRVMGEYMKTMLLDLQTRKSATFCKLGDSLAEESKGIDLVKV